MDPEGTILLVEDNDDDVFFMRRALKTANLQNPLQVAQDGQAAIDYINGTESFSDRSQFPFPCLVLLDLKLPRKTGLEVLAAIQGRKKCPTLIIVVLTTSRESADIDQAYQLGANAYLVKPTSPTELAQMMTALRNFWIAYNIVR